MGGSCGMSEIFNVFDTYEEALIAQDNDFRQFKNYSNSMQNTKYWADTTAWANVQERTDGKFVYTVYPNSQQKYKEEQKEDWWFENEN